MSLNTLEMACLKIKHREMRTNKICNQDTSCFNKKNHVKHVKNVYNRHICATQCCRCRLELMY